MPLLFEYGKYEEINDAVSLRRLLINIWQSRLFVDFTDDTEEQESASDFQPFLEFREDGIKARNFVGFIQNVDEKIEIYPKVFRERFPRPTEQEKFSMLRQIFYWFSYCRRSNFPFSEVPLDTMSVEDFPELIINLIARQFLETVSNQPLTMYQEVGESLSTPRGSINFKRYLANSVSYGNLHAIECDYEPFLFDNRVNRILKYCARLLMNRTKFVENLQMLQEVVFILDDVDDVPCTIHDLSTVSLNAFFDDYAVLLNHCRLILGQQLYSSRTYDLSQWCLLFPMEYIFEDFVAGFLESHFGKTWKVEYQKSNEYLCSFPKVFRMQHDIFLTRRDDSEQKVIVDTKYKLRKKQFKSDPKRGVDQSDLYQMISYAFRRGCTDVLLLYPNLSEDISDPDNFEVHSGFHGDDRVLITAAEIPFWTQNEFDSQRFEKTLVNALENILDIVADRGRL